MAKKAGSYAAKDIEVLEGLEPVRKRPGMYIGGTDSHGLHHLVAEILDNSVDEAMNGHASEISLILHEDGESVTIEDNGRGIPVDKHPKFKKSALELILTTLHAGGKFSDLNYRTAGGLHGVGASVVNALSQRFEVTVWRDGHEWFQEFEKGKSASALKRKGASKLHGTSIFFRPDSGIFKNPRFSTERLETLVENKAFLNKGVKLRFVNQQDDSEKEFCYKEGLKAYLDKLLKESELGPIASEVFTLEYEKGIKVEAAFCWTESTQDKLLSFVNGIHTSQGGSHEDGFKNGLSKALRSYITTHDLLPKGMKLTADDIREGLIGVLSVMIPGGEAELQFQGQTKERLNNSEVTAPVENLIRTMEKELNSKPSIASQIVERILLASKARAASRAASQSVSRKVGISHRLTLPGKLADCSSNQPEKSELFIVEGDSAGGSAKMGRDRKTQAVLPLRGKILNAFAASDGKVKENKELVDLISALGCGYGEDLRLEKLRYSKVVILTDADADGMHIGSLLIAFFYKFMRKLIENGNIYIGMSPLYKIKYGSGAKETVRWVFSEAEKEKVLKEFKGRGTPDINRFKGLGEMDPKTLWETTLDPKHRSLLRITLKDRKQADDVLSGLLGKDSSARYRLIQENADRLEVDL